ncbi:hypothetical protein UCRNP2_10231 [Neofusicoccum parvum UCRNP2]|uniref:Subtilisin-like serine protease protein n=1 Tax=Botryosphaeria parva (strain UCR-NP2) TaxID=1287680 RepID=R1FVH1_BOTPV|nr:hypothetical protein UCRNP2_10231 [Neofusicoccum parvum UCRNP2]
MRQDEHSFLAFLPTAPGPFRQPNASARLPGHPNLALDDAEPLAAFLTDELECADLDAIADRLWLMSKQSSGNISPLHRQRVKGREIVVTEEPKLHLIWFYSKIHVKPLPRYLLSRAFWQDCLLSRKQQLGANHPAILASALGFFRSYAHLIRHESDLRIAQDRALALIPDWMGWDQWCLLRAKALEIRNDEVSGRFQFGEIRLTRLNFYCKFLLRKAYYHRTHRQYGDYFASFYPPLLFLFGIFSIMLASMQLVASVEELEERWRHLLGLFRMFSVAIIAVTFMLLIMFVLLLTFKIGSEWIFALRCRYSLGQGNWGREREKAGP